MRLHIKKFHLSGSKSTGKFSLIYYNEITRNSRWHRLIGSNSIWYNHMIIHIVQLIGFSSQWACFLSFKYLASVCCSNCRELQKPSTSPSSTCIDLLQGDFMYVIHRLFHICYMCSSSISYMLTAACCGCIGSSKYRYLLCHSSVADLIRPNQTL